MKFQFNNNATNQVNNISKEGREDNSEKTERLAQMDLLANTLVDTAIKRTLIYSAAKKLPDTTKTVEAKKTAVANYKNFLAEIAKLPEIEKEFFLLVLARRQMQYEIQVNTNLLHGRFDNAQKMQTMVDAAKTAHQVISAQGKVADAERNR